MTTHKTELSESLHRGARRRSRRRRLLAAIGPACLAFGLLACGSEAPNRDAPSPPSIGQDSPTTEEATSGSVSLALEVAGVRLTTVSYTVVGGAFVKSGSFDVTNSTRITGVIGGIPFGNGYALTLNSSSAGPPQTTCNGSASFNLTNQVPVAVPVQLSCRQSEHVAQAAMPAPIPPFAGFALALALLGLGMAAASRSRQQG